VSLCECWCEKGDIYDGVELGLKCARGWRLSRLSNWLERIMEVSRELCI
jgi:hypothetical protein